MADEFIISRANEGDQCPRLAEAIELILNDDREAKITVTKKNNGTIPMLRTWRLWMATAGEYMANNGATMPLCLDKDRKPYGSRPFTADDAHELFSYQFMPVANGVRKSWVIHSDKHGEMQAASIGEKLHAMERMQQWAVERGINLYADENSEYIKTKNETVGF